MSSPPRRTRVAILGGGCGAMATAYALTKSEALRRRFEVTVYQHGWRLGGKGASGRNGRLGQRIEEHGLHMWMGFYDNAFHAMRACYDEWGKVAFDKAFTPQPQISLAELVNAGEKREWKSWNISPVALPGVPGTERAPLLVELLHALVGWVLGHVERAGSQARGSNRHVALREAHRAAAALASGATHLHGELHGHLAAAHAHSPRNAAAEGLSDTLRHIELLIDLGIAGARGLVRDILPHGNVGFDRINDLEFRDWLRTHGASETAVNSAPIRALYDLGFAYVAGDTKNPESAQGAAGVTLRVLLHMAMGCRGSTLWKMHAGMGDTVFTPFYEVLQRRGVTFRFFHRVKALRLSQTKRLVTAIELDRQVDLVPGRSAYDPLVDVRGLPCWPSDPNWEQVAGGREIARRLEQRGITLESAGCDECVGKATLTLGREFDVAVVAMSLAPLPDVCRELVDASDRWRAMVDNVATVATQAFQLWTRSDLADMGWTAGPTVMTGYAEPLDSWADMSHLIPVEDWPSSAAVRGIHYFCGALSDEEVGSAPDRYPRAQRIARENARAWLEANIGAIWPRTVRSSGFEWSRLVAPDDRNGEARFEDQYFRGNVDPSERYVLSVPGSVRFRMNPEDSDFDNVLLAGDWTRTRFNSGCVEAAMESGLRAARALAGAEVSVITDD